MTTGHFDPAVGGPPSLLPVLLLVLLEDRNCQKLAQPSRNDADAQTVAAQAIQPQNPRQSLSFPGGLDGLIIPSPLFDPGRRHLIPSAA